MDVTSSKTLKFWLYLIAAAAAFIFTMLLLDFVLSTDGQSFIDDFLSFLGIAGGGGTARNIISDGIAPRIPQAIGASKDPSVSVESPKPMVNIVTDNYSVLIPRIPTDAE